MGAREREGGGEGEAQVVVVRGPRATSPKEAVSSRCSSYSCLLTLMSCATKAAQGASTAEAAYTLNSAQVFGLASIIELAGESDEGGEAERACVEEAVRVADAAFTAEASASEVAAMWSADEGIEAAAALRLRERVGSRLATEGSAVVCAGSSAVRRAANALVNACLSGRSAHFKTEQSVADQFVSLVGPARFWTSVAAVLVLAVGGACAMLDWLVVENVLGPREAVVPCECELCVGRVSLGSKVGAGGFGAVWRCTAPEGVVLKLVEVDLERDVNRLRLALDEAKHLVALDHEHVVAYYDMFVHRDAARKDYFCIAMEDCQGGTLLDHVASGVPFPLRVLASALAHCSAALAYVHARGLVHRDVKLENIFVKFARGGRALVKIGDFGLAVKRTDVLAVAAASARGDDRSRSAVAGTETYQAPECFLAGHDLGPPVDAWALGCALYEMATCVSLPTEPPLGRLVADDADDPVADLAARLDATLAVAVAAHLAGRALSLDDKRAARDAAAGLADLFRRLVAAEPGRRPTMPDVVAEPFLQPFARDTLDFFAFNAASRRAPPATNPRLLLRAKSQASRAFALAPAPASRPKTHLAPN